jgi:16S rRNA (uracil1498-N3)-methyltransferase
MNSQPDQPRARLYAEAIDQEMVELPAGESHHALGVLRLKDGATVEVFDGRGGRAAGMLTVIGRGKAAARITVRHEKIDRPLPWVTLAFAPPKGNRLDWLLEKAAELGVAQLCPIIFERSVVRPELSEHARARWQAVCISAAKQCGAAFLPEILPPASLADFLATPRPDLGILGHLSGLPLKDAWPQGRPVKTVAILVGPEGDFTDAERDLAVSAGFIPARLGHFILRVETAAIALLAAVATLAGDR